MCVWVYVSAAGEKQGKQVHIVLVMIRLRHEITLGFFSAAYEIHKARQMLPTFEVPLYSCNFNWVSVYMCVCV